MSVFVKVEAELAVLKTKVEGELHTLVTHLESIANHIHQSPVEDVVKAAVASDIQAAAAKVEIVADTMRSDVDGVAKAVDAVDTVVDETASK